MGRRLRWGGGAEAAGCDIKQVGGIWASVPLSTRARISPGITAGFRCAGERLGRKVTALARGAGLAAGRERRGAGVRASSADRWARGRLLASVRVSGGCGPSAGSELKRELGRAQRGGARWAAARWAGAGPEEREKVGRRREGAGWAVKLGLGWVCFPFSLLDSNHTQHKTI